MRKDSKRASKPADGQAGEKAIKREGEQPRAAREPERRRAAGGIAIAVARAERARARAAPQIATGAGSESDSESESEIDFSEIDRPARKLRDGTVSLSEPPPSG